MSKVQFILFAPGFSLAKMGLALCKAFFIRSKIDAKEKDPEVAVEKPVEDEMREVVAENTNLPASPFAMSMLSLESIGSTGESLVYF